MTKHFVAINAQWLINLLLTDYNDVVDGLCLDKYKTLSQDLGWSLKKV